MREYQNSSDQEFLPTLRNVMSKHEIYAKKSLGQHFLLDTNLTDKIARIANIKGSTVIEIGPGPGGLTRSLLINGAKKIIAIEKDPRCLAALLELQSYYSESLTIVEADAMNIDFSNISSKPFKIVANLPYNISTPLLIGWLRKIEPIRQMTLTFQKEVADRLVASPSTKAYGRLSVITQWLCNVNIQFNIDSLAFVPPPKVVSSVVTLLPRDEPIAPADWLRLEKVTSAAFNQRRKMLRSSLRNFNLDLPSLGINPTLRAENLTIEQFCQLARSIRD